MDLNTSKILGGTGALLMFISILPYVNRFGSAVWFIGLILIMIGAYGVANHYREPGIFNNALYGVVVVIIGLVATVALAFFAFVNIFSDLGLTLSNVSIWETMITQITESQWIDAFFKGAGYIFLTLAVFFAFIVVAAVFFRKSMTATAQKTGVGLFGTAGMIVLIGAILTIIAFGIILLWISLLIIAIAFFQIKPEPAPQMQPVPPPQPTQQI